MPKTKLYGLIGFPLSHSFSIAYFEEKFVREAIEDTVFENFELADIAGFPQLLRTKPNLCGLAVTIPYKERVMPFLNSISTEALAVGAVNCIKIYDGATEGFNTDIIGFQKSFSRHLLPNHTHALILGSGGAAKAVEYVLNKLDIQYLLASRKPSGGQIHYADIDRALLSEYKIIINCTPVGMYPKVEELPLLPYNALTENHYLYDLVYNPEQTLFLKKGRECGAIVQNGYDMLVYQAEENWRIWNS